MIRNLIFSISFFTGIIIISLIFLPGFFLPQKIVLFGGKLMGHWTSFCLKFFLSTKIVIKGTENIIKACEENSAKIVYVSTSAVFDGSKNEYFEDDEPSPLNYYGETKATAEKKIQQSKLDYLILRTDQPYCWTEKWQRLNSVIRILDNFSSNKIHNEVTDWYNKPTFVPNFVENTLKLIDINSNGIFHIVGTDFISRLDWSMILCDVFKLDKNKVTKILSKDLNLPAKRGNININRIACLIEIAHQKYIINTK